MERLKSINFIEVESVSGLQDLKGGVEEVNLASMLTNKKESTNLNGESNNIEQDNEGELKDNVEVYNFEEDLTLIFVS